MNIKDVMKTLQSSWQDTFDRVAFFNVISFGHVQMFSFRLTRQIYQKF